MCVEGCFEEWNGYKRGGSYARYLREGQMGYAVIVDIAAQIMYNILHNNA